MRQEKDSLGVKGVPEDAYYGVFTQRAMENFKLSGHGVNPELIRSIVLIKQAAAQTNASLGLLDKKKSAAIEAACKDVLAGKVWDFPLDTFQAGAGTPANMNVNEVLANRATEHMGGKRGSYIAKPHEDVNMCQSSNDVIPTALRIAVLNRTKGLVSSVEELEEVFRAKAEEFDSIIKVGRTHLQDAVPIRLGQEFEAYAISLEKARKVIEVAAEDMLEIGIGGTAIGTGINTPQEFSKHMVRNLSALTGYKFHETRSKIQLTQSMEAFVDVSNSLRILALETIKISNDLILLSSGPFGGIGEIRLPAVEEGSSIMPGKINPSITEAFKMSCFQVLGNDYIVAEAAKEGQLELNVMTPLIAHNLLSSIELMTAALKMFAPHASGIQADKKRCQELFKKSFATATALAPRLGYEKVASLVREAIRNGKGLDQIVLEKRLLSESELKEMIDPKTLTRPNMKIRKAVKVKAKPKKKR